MQLDGHDWVRLTIYDTLPRQHTEDELTEIDLLMARNVGKGVIEAPAEKQYRVATTR